MTAPPAGALEACPFCGGEAMTSGGPDCGYVIECSVSCTSHIQNEAEAIAAWNRRTHGPALLAALRLREGCEARVEAWRDVGNSEFDNPRSESTNERGRGRLLCADDLARILEQTK